MTRNGHQTSKACVFGLFVLQPDTIVRVTFGATLFALPTPAGQP